MKRFSLIALALMLLLSTRISQLFAQTISSSPSSSTITNDSVMQQRLDLALLIAQRNYYKDRYSSLEGTVQTLSNKLQALEQSLQTAQDPTQLQGEIADLRKQLDAAKTSLSESRGTLDTLSQKVADQQGLIDKTDKDHRTEADRWQYLTWTIGSAGVGAASMAIGTKGDPAMTGLGAVGGAAIGVVLKWIFSGF